MLKQVDWRSIMVQEQSVSKSVGKNDMQIKDVVNIS